MKSRTDVEVQVDDRGRSRATALHCEAPLLVRIAAAAPSGPGRPLTLLLVGGSAGPLGGDDLQFRLHVGAGALVIVRSVGATMVQPGATRAPSTADVHVSVADGATLDWCPEPTVSVIGSEHRSSTTIELAATARLRWVDEISLGRFGEPPGLLTVHQRVEIDGRVIIDHETSFGTRPLAGPGANGTGRCVLTELIVDEDAPTAAAALVEPGLDRGVFPIAEHVALLTSISANRATPGPPLLHEWGVSRCWRG